MRKIPCKERKHVYIGSGKWVIVINAMPWTVVQHQYTRMLGFDSKEEHSNLGTCGGGSERYIRPDRACDWVARVLLDQDIVTPSSTLRCTNVLQGHCPYQIELSK